MDHAANRLCARLMDPILDDAFDHYRDTDPLCPWCRDVEWNCQREADFRLAPGEGGENA